jgi:hypothetical protein
MKRPKNQAVRITLLNASFAETPVEVMADGSLRPLSKKEVRKWRKRTKTRIRKA